MGYRAKIEPHFWGIVFFLFCLNLSVFAGGGSTGTPSEAKRDTVSAIVMYGENLLFESIKNLTDSDIEAFRDSLVQLDESPGDLITQIDLYLHLKTLEEEDMILLIDSLFDAEEVPYALINQINLYISNRPDIPNPELSALFMGNDTSMYPANSFYGEWNTQLPNPYGNSISKEDTTIYLLLQGTKKLEKFAMPVDNVITSRFGWRDGRQHNGIDIDLEVWDPVASAFPGMVRVARYYGGYGRVVVIRHFNGLETTYAHLHRIKVKPGQIVQAGDIIGLGGSSGHSTGSHLHFECRFKGKPVDPMNFISFREQELINDTLILKRTKYGYAAYPEGITIHTVAKGDCLYDIAEKYGTTANKLCELNGIRRNSILVVGQRIRVI